MRKGKQNISIREAIQQIANATNESKYSFLGSVVEVNGTLCDVEPFDGGATVFDVRINTDPESTFLITPKVGSFVMVTMWDKYNGFISQVAKPEKYLLSNDTENLRTILEDLIQAIQNITVSSSPSGGPTSTPVNSAEFATIATRLKSLLE